MNEQEYRKKLDEAILVAQNVAEEKSTDPLLNLTPHPKQKEFIDAVLYGEQTEVWAFTSNRWGKTLAGGVCGSTFARFGDPETGRATTGWVISPDNNTSRDIVEPVYFDNGFVPKDQAVAPLIPNSEILEWRKKDKILKLKNGSFIGFKSCESKGRKFPGAEKDWIHYDEPPDKAVYDEGGIRVGAGKKLRIFGTCTILPPEGTVGGISWLYPHIIKREFQLPHVRIFRGSIYDNPYLDEVYIETLKARYIEGTQQYRIRIDGELLPGIGGARVYSPFDRGIHIPEVSLPFHTGRPLAWVWDFNVEPMVSLVGQKIGNKFNIFKELILEEGNVFEMVDLFRDHYPTHGAEIHVFGDATGKRRDHQTRHSSYSLIMKAMSNYPVPVRLRLPEKNPNVPDRINAVNIALRDPSGVANLAMTNHCPELMQDFEEVLSDNKQGIKKKHNKKDPYFRRTHVSDAIGYWIWKEAPPRKVMAMRPRERFKLPDVPAYAFN